MIRTRFSFYPKKHVDIEDLRNALFSYLIAKHEDGEFFFRIEDSHLKSYENEYQDFAKKIFTEFGLNGDYEFKKTSENHKAYAEKLVNKGKAYYCFCTEEELNRKRLEATENKTTYIYDGTCRLFPKDEARRKVLIEEQYVIRQRMPKEGQTTFRDLVYGDITTLNSYLEDQILIKSDGTSTYNFANVIDDALMNITHVTMSEKVLTSTPKYLLLYESLGFSVPKFIHYPRIVTKLENTLIDLLNQGFLKEAILNYIALLGWSPKSTQEFFTLEQLIQKFDFNHINKRPACFDIKKLKWFNHQYIIRLSDEEYITFVKPYLEQFYKLEDKSEEWIRYLLLMYKKQIYFASEIVLNAHMFFVNHIELEEKEISYLKSDTRRKEVVNTFKDEVKKELNWNRETIKEILEHVKEKTTSTGSLLYMPIRISITGKRKGPDLVDCLYLLGQKKVLERLETI